MKIRRFVAKDMRTALAQIKEELGVEAVIMSNKKIAEGVELMAAIDYSQAAPAQPKSSEQPNTVPSAANHQRDVNGMKKDVVTLGGVPTANSGHSVDTSANNTQQVKSTQENGSTSAPADSLSALLNRQVQQTPAPKKEAVDPASENIEQQFKRFTQRLEQSDEQGVDDNGFSTAAVASTSTSTASNQATVSSDEFHLMQKEMASIRQLLEHQVSGLMWQDLAQKDPQRAVLVNRLMAIGLTEQIADQIAGYLPAQSNESQAWQDAKQLVAQQLNTTNNDIINRGGVVALVGPTGVGKTTTIAKLAARFSQVHGADQVALISTDTFRIAGFEQLNTYGKIIGCQVKLAKDAEQLDSLLQQFSSKKLILIDTAGMGQRDMRLAEHLTTLVTSTRVKIRNYLVLAANTQQRVMQENVERFKKVPLSGSIYTKLDESVSIGEIISTSIQNGLPIGYLTDGQRVPEDIKVANVEKLVTLADKMAIKVQSPHHVPVHSKSMNHVGAM